MARLVCALVAAACAAVATAQGAAATPSRSPTASPGYVTTLASVASLSTTGVYGVDISPIGGIFISTSCAVWHQTVGAQFALFVGTNTCDFGGDGGPASSAPIYEPRAVTFDAAGNAYITEPVFNRVRVVSPAGVIRTAAGTGYTGSSGDGGPASLASLTYPSGAAIKSGVLYVLEAQGFVRAISLSTGVITMHHDFSDVTNEWGPLHPCQLAFGASGMMFVALCVTNRVFRVSPAGVRTTIAGTGNAGFDGDGGAATAALLACPRGVAIDSGGNVFIADNGNFRIRRVSAATGFISTIAGTGYTDHSPNINDGPALTVAFGWITFLAIDGCGDLLFTDLQRGLRVLHGVAVPPATTPTATRALSRASTPSVTPSPTLPVCRPGGGLNVVTALTGNAGVAPPASTATSGNGGMYTSGACSVGFQTFFPGPRLVYVVTLDVAAPLGGTLTVTTCGHTANNTVLYVGTGCPTWDRPFGCKASNDDAVVSAPCGSNARASTVALVATQQVYFVQLGGFSGVPVISGLQWSYAPPASASRSASTTRSRTRSRTASRTRSTSATRSRSRKRKL